MTLKEFGTTMRELFTVNWKDTRLMLIPSVLYAIQNNLLYVAISNLNAVVYQVSQQAKILTTALFSVIILNRHLTWIKWFSLMLLTIGVVLIQIPENGESNSDQGNTLIGLSAVAAACFSSGFAGVYFEKLVKQSDADLWIRNIQLGIFTFAFSVVAMLKDSNEIVENGFFHGYNHVTFGVLFLQAAGGLIVAVVMKYCNNIVKAYATSASIVLSIAFTCLTSTFQPTHTFVAGTAAVILSVYLYAT
jgi:UDP-sugar transporter A1/2/3